MKLWRIGIILILLCSCKKEFPNAQALIMGHAGESIHKSKSKYPPNTLPSILRAFEEGAHGVEVDVQMTADGELLVYHDNFLDDNSSGTGCINDKQLTEISNLTVYRSDWTIPLLSEVVEIALNQGKYLILDVKHVNFCSGNNIDYSLFNNQFNSIISGYTIAQKELITVNCTNKNFLFAITDTLVNKSIESDDPESAIQNAIDYEFNMVCLKLSVLNADIRQALTNNNIDLCIFNVKARTDINKALEFNPEYIITDNIPCTIKAING